MALTISCDTSEAIGLPEYLEFVRQQVDPRDLASIVASAGKLRALANDPLLVARALNEQVKRSFKGDVMASAQVIFLGSGTDFYVRANIWPSNSDIANGRLYQDQFSYHVAHDHNYSFLTAAYSGSGYTSDIYEYDHESIEGYAGEPVDIRFLERVNFAPGMVMLYRASRDVHIQYPSDEMSITLNLMLSSPEVRIRDQYFFDVENRVLLGFPPELDGSRRVSLVEMAGHAGNADTRQLLTDLATSHPSRRTRLTAFEALERLAPDNAEAVWDMASGDAEPLVAKAARRRLDALSRG